MVYEWRWLHLNLPSTCILCGASGERGRDLCAPCAEDLPWNTRPCPRCAMPLPVPDAAACGRCQADPPRQAACIAPLRYEFPVRELLGRFKFDGDLATGRMLAELLAERIDAGSCPREMVLVPVPLHPGRLAERGFNQSERIARVLAARLGLTLATGTVVRNIASRDQKSLGARERRANLRNAFTARPCAGMRAAIVDDVLTTGATLDAVCAALLDAGAREVRAWCVARAT